MTSEDVNAMMTAFTGGRPPGVEGPLLPGGEFFSTQTSTSDYLSAFGKVAVGVGNAGRSIGAGRAAEAEGRIAGRIAKIEAERERMKGRRLQSTAKAITGAQGTTDEGSPALAELALLQAANIDANTKIFEGNVNEYHARQKAKAAYMNAPADLLAGLLEAQLDLDPTKRRAGKSLLTGK